jgi:hypothetical protein
MGKDLEIAELLSELTDSSQNRYSSLRPWPQVWLLPLGTIIREKVEDNGAGTNENEWIPVTPSEARRSGFRGSSMKLEFLAAQLIQPRPRQGKFSPPTEFGCLGSSESEHMNVRCLGTCECQSFAI